MLYNLRMPRAGRDLEKLVALIEQSTHGNDRVSVRSPLRISDIDTGKPREHDVVIEFRHDHLRLTVALECRDRTARVGSPAVEAFWAKCLKTGINSGVIVSSSGFSAPALKKAAGYNIRCLSLTEAEGFHWCECGGIWFTQPEIIEGQLDCLADEPITTPYKIYTDEGNEFTPQHASRIAGAELSKVLPPGTTGGPHKQLIIFGPQSGYVVGNDGKCQKITAMYLRLIYRVNQSFLPFRYHRYADDAAGNEISAAASAEFVAGDVAARLMLLKQPDGGIRLTVSHAPRDPAAAESSNT